MTSRQQIRASIRLRRNRLSPEQQLKSANQLVLQYQKVPELYAAQTIAIYLSSDGEIDTQPLINWLWEQGKRIVLPVIHPFSKGHLLFLEYTKNTELIPNKYRILEPRLDKTTVVPLSQLDLILTPLIAFDSSGNRLGMGGGYYDRTLTQWHHFKSGPMPIGVAHSCQEVSLLATEPWDVPLPYIITPTDIYHW